MPSTLKALDARLDWRGLPHLVRQVIDLALDIQAIPAPTFQERARAEFVAAHFVELGLQQIEIDAQQNVYALIPGVNPDRALMLTAHTDTVFPASTDLTARRDGDLIYGPGLGDNSIGVAAMLGLASFLRDQRITPGCNIWLVANSQEEGLGDLCGMKAAFARLQDRVQAIINIEGMALGHIYRAGIAVRRLHITAQAEGGHSWLNFGRPSAIHGLIEVGARILAIEPPASPRTTYNIGLIEGGQSINTIASKAELWLDLRSEDARALRMLENEVRQQVEAAAQPGLRLEVRVVGDRPAGSIHADHPLVQIALEALEQVGIQGTLESGSTDANVPLAAGCPAITIGITRGGNAHRLDEYIETPPAAAGLRQLILVVLTAAQTLQSAPTIDQLF